MFFLDDGPDDGVVGIAPFANAVFGLCGLEDKIVVKSGKVDVRNRSLGDETQSVRR